MSDRNHHLGNKVVKPQSNCKVWWSCLNCPDRHPHIWEARVADRTNGTGCPYCSGMELCKHNSLATISPATMQYWHKEKNLPWSPETVTAGSQFRAHWLCPVCSHEWQCHVKNKVQRSSGCPECAKTHVGRSKDGTRLRHPTFASCKHPLLSQWDHDLNARQGTYPDNTTLASAKQIWWTCNQCPEGNKHSWLARPYNRTRRTHASGCPFCFHKQPCDCNSLQTHHPELAADFDSKANGLTPDHVTASSEMKYRWLSDKPGAPLRSISQRTQSAKRRQKRISQAEAAAQHSSSSTKQVGTTTACLLGRPCISFFMLMPSCTIPPQGLVP